MKVYTYSQARQHLSEVLDMARSEELTPGIESPEDSSPKPRQPRPPRVKP